MADGAPKFAGWLDGGPMDDTKMPFTGGKQLGLHFTDKDIAAEWMNTRGTPYKDPDHPGVPDYSMPRTNIATDRLLELLNLKSSTLT